MISSVNVTSEGTALIIFTIVAEHACTNCVSDWSLDEVITKIKQLNGCDILIHRAVSVSVTAKNPKVRRRGSTRGGNKWILGRPT